MTTIRKGYLIRIPSGSGKEKETMKMQRNWWIPKYQDHKETGIVRLGNVSIPKEFMGKKLRFKVEIIE